MFEQAVQVSEAFRESARQMHGSLHMALKGCPECRTTQMIASPVLGICEDCGSGLVVLPRE
ncbi:hypothetical protein KHP60_02770 [Microvirga sp. 3-52]|uniref:hypothetical protein n=1 Tax=Microvirga sp. 3-52 TaxID=2792425 RepID=UPI001AC79582|nr:hypothetical protein [Microvirga sp. 3-52]MBO1903849.1 hypothetical protein [Microvirga sp. 3-52]MBS7451269.1 hypothetical protein [Microvirga sp. 3-52]